MARRLQHRISFRTAVLVASLVAVAVGTAPSAVASHTPSPSSVTVIGDMQSELGCLGDFDAACPQSSLAYDAGDAVWQGIFALPAGDFDYKVALNGGFDENYGQGGVAGGANIGLALASGRNVKFYYDHQTHWITDDVNSTIVVAAGSFQSELGCSGDFDASCLRSWLQDVDGDGAYTRSTTDLPAGEYTVKATIGESYTENYGQGGTANGPDIPFTVPDAGSTVSFSYASATHVLTVTVQARNRVPVATDDSYTTPLGQPLTVAAPGVLTNDQDPDGDSLTVATPAPATAPSHGSVHLAANGGFTYVPAAAFAGADSFTYRTSDGAATSAAATVRITVAYPFTGFAKPLRPEPQLAAVNAGSTVPVKFGLGGNYGLNIFAAGSPTSRQINCQTLAAIGSSTQTTPRRAGLTYDAATQTYAYNWQTAKAWTGTCRQMVVTLTDGTDHRADVRFG